MNPLSTIAMLDDAETRSICAENPTGERGGGARAEPLENSGARRLGKGWKARPCIPLPAGEVTTIAEIEGPGTIEHIWVTIDQRAYRGCILRMYWDGETDPSVEVPLGDFFANGHGIRCNINSIPVAVHPDGGFNSYWPMPFRRSARITVENQTADELPWLFYQVTYALGEVAENAAYFHAQWRRSVTPRANPDHVLLDNVSGPGRYVGTYLAFSQLTDGWWGEGEIKFYIDGDTDYPTICGTGTEDYVGGAWCFGQTYSGPFLGYPLWVKEPGVVPKHGLYRWHVPDPIRFRSDLRVTIQAIGVWPDWSYQPLEADIASVAYWYQTEPHGPFPAMPGLLERFPR